MILLQESLGAQFIGTLGGKPLSPNVDQLAKKGGYLKIFMQQAHVQYEVLKQQRLVLRQRQLVQW